MNISAKDLSFHMRAAAVPGRMSVSEGEAGRYFGEKPAMEKQNGKVQAQDSYEQTLIDNFKEENSSVNRRVNQIYYKFLGGKELSAAELDFLAEHNPELYKEVQEVMMERKALEMRMKLAKTKMEVQAIATNAMMNIKATKGSGEQEKAQAPKTMARVNHMSDAYNEYTATLEYKHKEDAEDQAKELREKMRDLEAEGELLTENLTQLEEEMHPLQADMTEQEKRLTKQTREEEEQTALTSNITDTLRNTADQNAKKEIEQADVEQEHREVPSFKWQQMQSEYAKWQHKSKRVTESKHKNSFKGILRVE
ncbi:MAG: hypothetical protein IJ485_07885 [Lachnospiraceae bacterium]|nr:hypothetical protein [Lachnospiraceae bacterium]